ncbi:MAG: YjgN family protein [Pseudomonadota bacterium]
MASVPATPATRRLAFSGRGSEYFRIWIVNIALSLLTLGVYSAWAKVRRLRYFYLNTTLDEHSFDFHGDPRAILKGRIIAVALLVAYQLAGAVSPAMALGAMTLLALLFPWLIVRSLRFKLHNSSHRGLRFSFRGATRQGYISFLLYPLLALLSASLLVPLAHQRIKRYQHNRSWYADTPFAFTAGSGPFFVLYLKLLGLALLVIALVAGGAAVLFPVEFANPDTMSEAAAQRMFSFVGAVVLGTYLMLYLLLGPWLSARAQNLVWNHTTLGPHAFASDVRVRGLFWIFLTNFVGVVATLGLFKPYADVRLARYRLQHIALLPAAPLDAFTADRQQGTTATGAETADLFDFDISF